MGLKVNALTITKQSKIELASLPMVSEHLGCEEWQDTEAELGPNGSALRDSEADLCTTTPISK